MRQGFRLIVTSSAILLIVTVLICLGCSPSSSHAYLEKLSSDGQWRDAGTLGASPPLIGRNGNLIHVTVNFYRRSLFSSESVVLQANLSRTTHPAFVIESDLMFIDGYVNGKLTGDLLRQKKLDRTSEKLFRDDEGKLHFGATFTFGQCRIKLPTIEAQEAPSYRLRFGDLDADRIPKSWDIGDIVEGATSNFGDGLRVPLSRVIEAKILTWKFMEDHRSWAHDCVPWIHLQNPSQWMLVHVTRGKFSDGNWSDWVQTWREFGDEFWVKYFDHPPSTQEIESFLKANEWWSVPAGFRLLDAEVCATAWKKVTGQEPTFDRSRLSGSVHTHLQDVHRQSLSPVTFN